MGIHFYPDGNQVLSIRTGDVTAYKNILPSSDSTHNLGSSTLRWENIYLSGSVYFNGKLYVIDPGTGSYVLAGEVVSS